jgi:hypothetical protein
MPAPRCRPFTVLDAMILVAATAVGIWLGRSTQDFVTSDWPVVEWPDYWGKDAGTAYQETRWFLHRVSLAALPVAWPWTLALLVLRLRRPRPPVRRLIRQPGFAAGVAVTVVTAAIALGGFSTLAELTLWGVGRRGHGIYDFVFGHLCDDRPQPCGPAVASAWGVLAVGRMCRREPGWIDRTGAVLGAYWVVNLILESCS